jgi:hypothetical protein
VATEVLDDDHVPPVEVLVNVIEAPVVTEEAPVMVPASGVLFTVIVFVATDVPQLLVLEYVITTTPLPIPVTIPVLPTVAISVLLLVQLPPVVALARVVDAPMHNSELPTIVPMAMLSDTVTTIDPVAEPQVSELLYEIRAVPAPVPVTMPEALTVATAVLLLVHVPPELLEVNVVVDPSHNSVVPDSNTGILLLVCTLRSLLLLSSDITRPPSLLIITSNGKFIFAVVGFMQSEL